MKTLSFRRVMIRFVFITFPFKAVTEACFCQCLLNEWMNGQKRMAYEGEFTRAMKKKWEFMDVDSEWFAKQQPYFQMKSKINEIKNKN